MVLDLSPLMSCLSPALGMEDFLGGSVIGAGTASKRQPWRRPPQRPREPVTPSVQPWLLRLTIRRLLHQPPVLTEVVGGFAQQAAQGVILPGQGGGEAVSPASCAPVLEWDVWGAEQKLMSYRGSPGGPVLSPDQASLWPPSRTQARVDFSRYDKVPPAQV